MKDKLWARTPSYAVMLGLLLLWQISVKVFDIREYILPAPSDVLITMGVKWESLLLHGSVTAQEIVLGFLLSAGISVPLGAMIVFSKSIERALFPIMVASQTVPKVAIAPIFVLWLGYGILPKMLISFLVAFFPVVISTVVGLRSTEEEMVHLARSMGAGPLQTFMRFRLPRALPTVFGGLKVSMAMSVVGAIVGEFVGADKGLGYLLLVANGNMDSQLMFACVLSLTIMGLLFYNALELVERLLIPWERAKADRLSSATM